MTIEDRLENMEQELGRQKRRNRWLLGAILLVAGGLIIPLVFETTAFRARAQGAKTAKEVRAKAFIVEDENGKRRMMMSVTEDVPILALSDGKGKFRAGLSVTEYGPILALYDENNKPRAALSVDIDGPTMALYDEKGKIIWAAIK